MNRRDAIRRTALFTGAAALWAGLPARTWAALAAPDGWSKDEEDLLTLVGDTILPATSSSPGAGTVGIGRFVTTMTNECFGPEAAGALRRALREIEDQSHKQFSRAFATIAPDQREALLTAYEKRAAAETKGKAINPFRHLKELTLLGYFTSEPGATQALRYDPIPGTYRGSVPLAGDNRSWAL